jgi:hypothetical protein
MINEKVWPSQGRKSVMGMPRMRGESKEGNVPKVEQRREPKEVIKDPSLGRVEKIN